MGFIITTDKNERIVATDERKRAIIAWLKRYPDGIGFNDLHNAGGTGVVEKQMAKGTLRKYLNALQDDGIIIWKKGGNRKRDTIRLSPAYTAYSEHERRFFWFMIDESICLERALMLYLADHESDYGNSIEFLMIAIANFTFSKTLEHMELDLRAAYNVKKKTGEDATKLTSLLFWTKYPFTFNMLMRLRYQVLHNVLYLIDKCDSEDPDLAANIVKEIGNEKKPSDDFLNYYLRAKNEEPEDYENKSMFKVEVIKADRLWHNKDITEIEKIVEDFFAAGCDFSCLCKR